VPARRATALSTAAGSSTPRSNHAAAAPPSAELTAVAGASPLHLVRDQTSFPRAHTLCNATHSQLVTGRQNQRCAPDPEFPQARRRAD
jgi:hypothetical protein